MPLPTPVPTLAPSTGTSDSSVPSQPVNIHPNSNNPWAAALNNKNNDNNNNAAAATTIAVAANTTTADLTVTPAIPNPEVTAHLARTATAANGKAAPTTMGHKSRKAVLYITSFFVPPLAVYLRRGAHRKHFGLSVLLTLLGWWVPFSLYNELFPFLSGASFSFLRDEKGG